jgi:cytochrome c2
MSKARGYATNRQFGLFLVMSFVSTAVIGADLQRGRLLYEQHCTECHFSVLHERSGTIARSLDEIADQVRRWASYEELEWSQQEIEAVTRYLNGEFYNFELPEDGT